MNMLSRVSVFPPALEKIVADILSNRKNPSSRSTLIPEIKVEIIRVAMIRDLFRVFIILDPLNGGKLR